MSAREVARRVLDRVDKGGAWATLTLDAELARSGLDERDRRLASELVYGVLRHRTRIDRALAAHADLKKTPPKVRTALRVAAYQMLFLDRVPAYAAVDDAVAAARGIAGAKLAGFANAVLRKLASAPAGAREPALPAVTDAMPLDQRLARLEIEHSLPRWILDELLGALKVKGETDPAALARRDARLAELAAAFGEQPPVIARANRRKTTRDALAAELASRGIVAEPIGGRGAAGPDRAQTTPGPDHRGPVEPDGVTSRSTEAMSGTGELPFALRLSELGDPSTDPGFVAGRWTVQDAGAQLVAELAAPHAGMRILDACAGVGGKSTHLAELADDAAPIDAADQSATKLGLLRETAQRLGLTSITTHACDLLDPAAPLRDDYDLIVLDAPCSGLGVLRRHPDAKWRLTRETVPRLADLQRQLLDAIVKRLAPGGTLIYAVCTFTRAEGPDQIAAFAERAGMRIVDERRTWPPAADAFYMARLVRG